MNTDAGAEIHAEQAALINYNPEVKAKTIYLAGLDSNGKLLVGFDNRPCYSCARMIVYAGFTWIYLPIDGDWQPVNIYDVIENWEQNWEPDN
jgi:deoxycytidylate deaminase